MSVVFDDLEAAQTFLIRLVGGLESQAPIEGDHKRRVNGPDGVRVDIAMMPTPDGRADSS